MLIETIRLQGCVNLKYPIVGAVQLLRIQEGVGVPKHEGVGHPVQDYIYIPERHLPTPGQRRHSPQRHTAAGTAAPTNTDMGNAVPPQERVGLPMQEGVDFPMREGVGPPVKEMLGLPHA